MPIEIVNKSETEGEINVFGDITDVKWFDEDVTLVEFDKELKKLKGAKTITVNINCYGGTISVGVAMLDRLKANGAKIITNVIGIAASMGGVLAQGGDHRKISKGAMFMVHNPMLGHCGYFYAKELKKDADRLEKYKEILLGIFVDRTGQSKEQIASLMDEETFMTGEEAVAFGFADELIANKTVDIKNVDGKRLVNGIEIDKKLLDKMPKNFFVAPEPLAPEPEPAPEPVNYSMYENELSLITQSIEEAGI